MNQETLYHCLILKCQNAKGLQGFGSVLNFFFFWFSKVSQVFISGLILRDNVERQGEDLSQESLLHPQGLETKTTCLSDQSPFHSGQPSLVISTKLTTMLSIVFLCIVANSTITYNDTNNQLGQPASQDKPTQTKIR